LDHTLINLCLGREPKARAATGLYTKLWASKVMGVPMLGISGVTEQNDIWVLAPWLSTKYTIGGR